ncbi:MAG: methyltransferase [Pirellulaceae bacterium]|nr:methyltransferase [Pirellulaceae bacterium]
MNPFLSVPARPQEELLLELVSAVAGKRVLCNTAGRGQFALAAATEAQQVYCHFLDLYHLQQCRITAGEIPTNLNLLCEADFSAGPFDLAALSFSKQGDGELVRDLLQQGHERLEVGGRMAVSTDNPTDSFLHDELRKLFAKVTRRPGSGGVLYLATKTGSLRKLKNFACEFPFRDGARLVHLRTRPGVFSHRQLDGGARALMNEMQIQPGMRVLDLGCGSGAVAVAAALRAENVNVAAADSNPRALEATAWSASKNEVQNLTTILDCDGTKLPDDTYDLVLANAPYFANFRIAEHFARTAVRTLIVGGTALFVTKTPGWYTERLPKWFSHVEPRPGKNYTIVVAKK